MEEEVTTENESTNPIKKKNRKNAVVFLFGTILLGILFLLVGLKTGSTYLAPVAPVYKAEIAPDDKKIAYPEYFKYLEDSSFAKWTALVKGEIVSKEVDSFTLNPISEKFDETGNVTIANLP